MTEMVPAEGFKRKTLSKTAEHRFRKFGPPPKKNAFIKILSSNEGKPYNRRCYRKIQFVHLRNWDLSPLLKRAIGIVFYH